MHGEHKLLISYTLTKQAARSSETSAKLLSEYEVSYSTRRISSNFKIICTFGMFLFRKDHAEVPVPRPRIWLSASSVLQPEEGNTLKNLLVTRVIKMTWKREFKLHPKVLLQYLRIAVISLPTVHNGKYKKADFVHLSNIRYVRGGKDEIARGNHTRTQAKQSHMKSLLPYHVSVRAPLIHFEGTQSFHKKKNNMHRKH